MLPQAASFPGQAIKEIGHHAETVFGQDVGFIIITVPHGGGTGHIASNLDNRNLLRALRNTIGAVEPVVVEP